MKQVRQMEEEVHRPLADPSCAVDAALTIPLHLLVAETDCVDGVTIHQEFGHLRTQFWRLSFGQ